MYHDVGIIAIDPIQDSDFHEDIFNFNLSIDETFLGNTFGFISSVACLDSVLYILHVSISTRNDMKFTIY